MKGMLWLLCLTLIQHCHIAGPRLQEKFLWVSLCEHFAAGISLTCQRLARCCFVFNCLMPSHSCGCLCVYPLGHQVCFTFHLMNCSHEVIRCLQRCSLKRVFNFSTTGVMLTCVAPGLIFLLRAFLSNNEIKNQFLVQCYYLPQIKRFPV